MSYEPSPWDEPPPPHPRTVDGALREHGASIVIVTLAIGLVASVVVGDRRTAERDGIIHALRAKLSTTEADLDAVTRERNQARAELQTQIAAIAERDELIRVLSLTAQHWLARAAEVSTLNTDEADTVAIAILDEVPARWPTDPLVPAARDRKAELQRRIKGRADALRNAQAEVRRLIAVCKENHETANRIEGEYLVFNPWNNEVDLNAMIAGNRAARPQIDRMNAAYERALELLRTGTTPDPGNELHAAVERCR